MNGPHFRHQGDDEFCLGCFQVQTAILVNWWRRLDRVCCKIVKFHWSVDLQVDHWYFEGALRIALLCVSVFTAASLTYTNCYRFPSLALTLLHALYVSDSIFRIIADDGHRIVLIYSKVLKKRLLKGARVMINLFRWTVPFDQTCPIVISADYSFYSYTIYHHVRSCLGFLSKDK